MGNAGTGPTPSIAAVVEEAKAETSKNSDELRSPAFTKLVHEIINDET